MSPTRSSVLFIHGPWLHPSSWTPWMQLFDDCGYESNAPGWPGVSDTVEDTRANPDAVANWSIEEVADHYTRVIDGMPRRPVVIGHSFGGIIAEMLLARGRATAAIVIAAAHVDESPWLPFAPLRDMLPLLMNPTNRSRAVSLTADQFRSSFANTLDDRESDALYSRWSIPAPSRPLFEAAERKFSLYLPQSFMRNDAEQPPLLVVLGGQDQTVPKEMTEWGPVVGHSAAIRVVEFADRGHSLTIDSGWRKIAEACIDWLWNEHKL